MEVSRRNFLRGASAAVAVAALPAVPALPERMPGLFDGVTHIYNGVPIKEVVDLRELARASLRRWASPEYQALRVEMMERLLAGNCPETVV